MARRQTKTYEANYLEISKRQVQILAEEIFAFEMADTSGLYRQFESLRHFDLLDILKDELEETPNSPLIRELKRKLKLECLERAKKLAPEIVVKD